MFYGAAKSCTNDNNILVSVSLDINNQFSKLKLYNSSGIILTKNNNIKSSFSKNNNNIFVCYTSKSESIDTQCLIYNTEDNIFNNEKIQYFEDVCIKLETYFFNVTNEFICICYINNDEKNKENEFKIMKINNDSNEVKVATIPLKGCSDVNTFSLFYNKNNSDYDIISDCQKSKEY